MASKTEIVTKVLTALKTARAELRSLFERGIDAAEKGAPRVFAYARQLTQRLDETVGKTLDTAEQRFAKPAESPADAAHAA